MNTPSKSPQSSRSSSEKAELKIRNRRHWLQNLLLGFGLVTATGYLHSLQSHDEPENQVDDSALELRAKHQTPSVEEVKRYHEGFGRTKTDDSQPLDAAATTVNPEQSNASSLPPMPTDFAMQANTQSEGTASEIARLISTFHNYRAQIRLAGWSVEPTASWSIRTDDACLSSLKAEGVNAKPWHGPLSTPVATPVELPEKIGGVEFHNTHVYRPFVVSCEMAVRLSAFAKLIARHDIVAIDVISAYRDNPRESFHPLGLGLDIANFRTHTGDLNVRRDFEITPRHATCDAAAPTPGNDRARELRSIACDLAQSKLFSTVITPNYNKGHRDHFHLDVRPDDPRFFVR